MIASLLNTDDFSAIENMRFIVRAKMPTEAGNRAVQDPNFLKKLEEYMSKVKPEAAYFFEADGDRVAAFVVDMQRVDQIPSIAEPLFQGWGAGVEFHPVMSFDDLKKSLPSIKA
jgi:hypothetical protein